MIVQTLNILLLTGSILFIIMIFAFILLRKIPLREYWLIVSAFVFQFITYVLYFPLFYFSTPIHIDTGSEILSRLAYFFSMAYIVATTYAILLVDFKFTYQDIFEFLTLSWVAGAASIYNAMSITAELKNGSIVGIYTPIGIGLLLLLFIVEGYIWIRRFYEIRKVYRKKNRYKDDAWIKIYRFFMILGTFLTILYLITIFSSKYQAEIPLVSGCILSLIGIIALNYNNAYIFVTDIILDSIIIIEKKTGIRLYSISFNGNQANEKNDADFIGSVISAINVNFPNTIQSDRDLAEMIFLDKTVLIYSGEIVRSILVVSSTNLISKSLSKYLVKRFEKKFGKDIQNKIAEEKFISDEIDYTSFNDDITYVREFLPL